MKSMVMNLPMSKAVVLGHKTQTRRLIKNYIEGGIHPSLLDRREMVFTEGTPPQYQKGLIVWLRESVKITKSDILNNIYSFQYLADGTVFEDETIPNRFLYSTEKNNEGCRIFPRWIHYCQKIPNGCIIEMARIFLRITGVKSENLQDITFEDIFKEGFDGEIKDYFISDSYKNKAITASSPKELEILNWWIELWNSTASKHYMWEDNPNVFVYDFKKTER